MSERAVPQEPITPALRVDVVSDVVCPWCYIGKRRLETALVRAGASTAVIDWHPFQLNPDIPLAGVDRRRYLDDKFGGPERAQAVYARVESAGREVELPFAFDRIERQPNTVNAHRLIAWGQQVDASKADGMVERLFKAYFMQGIDIGAAGALTRLAGDAGYGAAAAAAFLATDGGRDDVAAADARMKAMGVSGVPFFIFNRRIAVSGAQPPEVLADAVAQARA